jgi:iron(III) transport system substrate-binding protein
MLKGLPVYSAIAGMLLRVCVLTLLVACGTGHDNAADPYEPPRAVVVYAAIDEAVMRQIFDLYTEQTEIRVFYIRDAHETLIRSIVDKSRSQPADLFIGGDAANLWFAAEEGVFRPTRSDSLQAVVPRQLRDPERQWFALTIRPRHIFYRADVVNAAELSTYAALGDPRWQGRLCLSSSAQAGNRSLIANLIAQQGEGAAEMTVRGWVSNLAMPVYPDDDTLLRALAAGFCEVGIATVPDETAMRGLDSDYLLAAFLPPAAAGGMHLDITGAGVTRHAGNPDGARQLLEWLVAGDGQQLLADGIHEKPLASLDRAGEFMGSPLNVADFGYRGQDAFDLAERAHYP